MDSIYDAEVVRMNADASIDSIPADKDTIMCGGLLDGKKTKSVFTFDSDNDLKTMQEIIKWARVKSLQAKGFTVVS